MQIAVKPKLSQPATLSTTKLILDNGASTSIHIAAYSRAYYQPEIIRMVRPSTLLEWCNQNKISHALSGGFFNRKLNLPLGDLWVAGQPQLVAPVEPEFAAARSCLHISQEGELQIDRRAAFIENNINSLIQAGPQLLKRGDYLRSAHHQEGFKQAAHQFDTDISLGRYPRSALGFSQDYIYCLAADGYSPTDAGLTLKELARLMKLLGAEQAINLDGGGSASLIYNQQLVNFPRTIAGNISYLYGRPIYSAITFKPF